MVKIKKVPQRRALLPHQIKALKFAEKLNHPPIFMDLRLGKTLVAIRYFQRRAKTEDIKLIVAVTPLTNLETWQRELELEGEKCMTLCGVDNRYRADVFQEFLESETRTWLIVNYELLRVFTDLVTFPFDGMVLDESVRIKNPKSKISILCTECCRNVKHRMILSGLPQPESEIELFQQFKFLTGSFLGYHNYWAFREAFFYQTGLGYTWECEPSKREYIHKWTHAKAFIMRRSEAGLGSKVVKQKRYVGMSIVQQALYNLVTKHFFYDAEDGKKVETKNALTKDVWCCLIAGGFSPDKRLLSRNKMKAIEELIKGELRGEQVVVWFRFRTELDATLLYLTEVGFNVRTLTSKLNQTERPQLVRDFREGKFQILLATIKCAKQGLDLSTADTAIYYSNEWSCDDRRQSQDRIIHPLKKTPVLLIDLITRKTLDEDVANTVRRKSFTCEMFLMKLTSQFYGKKNRSKIY